MNFNEHHHPILVLFFNLTKRELVLSVSFLFFSLVSFSPHRTVTPLLRSDLPICLPRISAEDLCLDTSLLHLGHQCSTLQLFSLVDLCLINHNILNCRVLTNVHCKFPLIVLDEEEAFRRPRLVQFPGHGNRNSYRCEDKKGNVK